MRDIESLAITALAAHRLTRLVTTDSLTEPIRERIFNRWPPTPERARLRWNGQRHVIRRDDDQPQPRRAALLLDCGWCASVWLSGALTVVLRPPRPIMSWLAIASAAGLLGAADRALAKQA